MASVEDRLRRVEAQNHELRRRLEALERERAAPAATAPPETPGIPTPASTPTSDQPPLPGQGWGWPAPAPGTGMEAGPAHGPGAVQAPPAPRPRDAAALEARLGTRWVALAGGIVLILALIVFLRLAFERGWIGPTARLALGWTGGVLLWGAGEVLRRRLHHVYGQVLAGTGMGLAYVTTWIAFSHPQYQAITGLSEPVGTVLLALLGVGLAAHAGFAKAPVLAGTALAAAHLVTIAGHDAGPTAFLGAAAVTVAILAAAAWRAWTWTTLAAQSIHLNLVLHATFNDDPALVLVASVLILLASAASSQRDPLVPSTAFATAWLLGTWSATTAALFWAPVTDSAGWTLLAAAIGALAFTAVPRVRLGAAVAGITLAVLWPWVHLDAPWAALVWGLELAILAGAAVRVKHPVAVIATSTLAGLGALWAVLTAATDPPFDVAHALTYGVIAVATWLAYVATRPAQEQGVVALVAGLLVPISAAAAFRDDPVVTLLWAVVAVAALATGAAVNDRALRFGGLAVIPLVLVRVLFIDMAGVDAVVRVLVFMAVGALLLIVGYAYARFLRRQGSGVQPET